MDDNEEENTENNFSNLKLCDFISLQNLLDDGSRLTDPQTKWALEELLLLKTLLFGGGVINHIFYCLGGYSSMPRVGGVIQRYHRKVSGTMDYLFNYPEVICSNMYIQGDRIMSIRQYTIYFWNFLPKTFFLFECMITLFIWGGGSFGCPLPPFYLPLSL